MKKLLVIAVCAAVAAASAAVFADGASSADPTSAKIAALQKQVKALQAQVKVLAREQVSLEDQLFLNFEGDTCLGAQTADLIQGTWGVIDQMATALQQKTYFGPQTQTNDYGNCGDLAQPDVPRRQLTVPPTLDAFKLLLQWLHVDL
jgi:hypothetical protein